MKDITHTAIRFTLIGAALAAALASTGAHAQNDIADGLIVGETAGACRIMRQLMQGSGFLGIVDAEADRLGLTTRELFQRCAQAAGLYAGLTADPSAFDVAQYFGGTVPEPTPASGPSTTAEFILAGPAR